MAPAGDCETEGASINVVYASRRQLLPRVRAFVDFMAERFGPAEAHGAA